MYKQISLLISLSTILLLPGCLDTWNKAKPEVQAEPTNIQAETSQSTETTAELTAEPKQPLQAPGLAAQATVLNLSSSSQLDELTSKGNVVVDFYGPNCGPCKSVSPVIDTLAQQYAGKVLFVKVNVDKFPDLSRKFSIKGVPTFYIFKDGQKVDSFSGARNKQAFEQKIKTHFNI